MKLLFLILRESLYESEDFMKSQFFRILSALIAILLAATLTAPAYAASVSSNGTGGGFWSDTAVWSGGSVPAATDDVTIVAGDTVTLTDNTTVNSLTIQSGATLNTADYALVVTGGLTNNGTFNAGASTLTLNGSFANSGTFNFGTSTAIYGASGDQTVAALTYYNLSTAGSGTKTAGGAIVVNGAFSIEMGTTFNAGATTLTLNGSLTNNGAFNAGTSTAIYGASGDQTVAALTYYNLQINGTGWKTLNGATTVTNLTVNGNLNVPGVNLTVNGATTVNGAINFSNTAGTKTFNGDVTIESGGMWQEGVAEAFTFAGNFTNNGTMDTDGNILTTPNRANSGVHTFTGASKTFSGVVSIPNVTIDGSYTNNGILNIAASLKGSGSLTQGTASEFHAGFGNADWTLTTFDATTNSNTVFYEKADDQTLKLTILVYHNLVLAGSGNKILPSDNFTVNGNLSYQGSAYSAYNVSGKTLWVKGDLTINSTYGGGPVLQIGQSNIQVDGATTITDGKLQHNNATGTKTYNGDFTVAAGGEFDNDGTDGAKIVAVTFNGNLTNNGTFTSGTGALTFAGAGKNFDGTLSVANANITGTYTNNGSLTVTSSLNGGGTLTQGATATLTLQAASLAPTLDASAAGNAVIYNLSGAQTVQPGTYHNLTLGGAAANLKTTAGVTVNGVLSIEGSAAVSAAPTYGPNATLQYNMTGTTAYTAGPEWVSPFNGSGGVIVKNGRKVLLNGDKVIAGNFLVQDANSKFDTGASAAANYHLTVNGDFTNIGTVAFYDSIVNIGGSLINAGSASNAAGAQISAASLTNYVGGDPGYLTLATSSTLTLTGNLDNGGGTLVTSGTSGYASVNLGGDYIDSGDAEVGRLNLILNGAGAQAIAGLNTQSGALRVQKTGGVATLTGDFGAPSATTTANRGPLEIISGTLNLGAGFTHRFSSWTMTAGMLEGGSSSVYFSGSTTPGAGVLDPESGTIRYDGNSNQPILGLTYYKLEVYRFSGTTAYTKALSGNVVVQDSLTIGTGITFGVGAFNIEVDGPTTINGKLSHTSNLGSKVYKGLVTVTGTWDNTANAPITFQGGLTVGGTFTGGTTAVYTFNTNDQTIGGTKAVTMGAVTVNGITLTNNLANGLTVTNLSGAGGLTQSLNAVLNISGANTINAFDASANPNTVNYTGAAAQTVKAGTYHHLGLSGAGAKTLTGVSAVNGNLTLTTSAAATGADLNIGGNLVINSGTFTVADHNITVNGTTTVNGSLVHASATGTKTYIGAVTIGGTAGKWTNSGNTDVHLRGGLINNSSASGSFTPGAGVYYFETADQAIGGSKAISIVNLDIASGVNVTNNNAAGLTLAGGSLTGNGTLTQGATGVLNIQFSDIGATSVTINASTPGNTVTYNLAGGQTVKESTYYTLTFAGSGIKTIPAGTIINGNFNINGTAVVNLQDNLNVPGNLTLSATSNVGALNIADKTLTVGGNWTRGTYGSFTGTGTVVFNGAAQQTINGVTTFPNLTVNNTGAGLLVKGNTTITDVLNLTNGVMTGSSSSIVIAINAGGTLIGGNERSYIYVAQLKKSFNVGAGQSFNFAVGDVNGYRPLIVSNMNVTTAGFVTAAVPVTPTEHAAVATSGINQLKNVNRYWKLTTGGGFVSSAFQAEFGFQNAHIDAGANPSAFMVRKYQTTPSTTPPWFVPELANYARDSVADPMMSVAVNAGFTTLGASSDFVVGELPPTGLTVGAINATYGDTVSLSATLLSNGLPVVGRTVDFNFNNGASLGSAVTNASGVATLSGVLLRVNAGEYFASNPGEGVVASFAGDITYSPSAGSANLTVARRPLTVSSVADTKEFDGTDSSDETPVITSGSLVAGDAPGTWEQKFDNMNIGTGKEMQIVALPIDDDNGGNNYQITTVSVSTGEITKRTLTITGGLTAFSRLYNGTNTVTVTPGALTFDGVLPAYSNVSVSVTEGVLGDKHVGADKPVSASGTLTGTDAVYYRLDDAPIIGLTADIYPYSAAGCAAYNADIDPDISCPPNQAFIASVDSVASGANKNYDGSNASAVSPLCNGATDCSTLLFAGDSVYQTFDSKNAGARTLTPYINDGNNGANYGSPTQNTDSATISPALLTVTADNKIAYVNTSLPVYTYTVTGFVPGESFFTPGFTPPTCSAPGASVSSVARYDIICSGANAGGNYTINYVNGSLQVAVQRMTTLTPVAPLQDGWILSSSALNLTGGSLNRNSVLFLGDSADNRQYRSVLSFQVNLPAGAVISSATLKMKNAGVVGRNPFMTHGSLFVNMSVPQFGGSPGLETSDFEALPSLDTVAGVVGKTPDSGGWYNAPLINSAKAALPLSDTVQFRLRFSLPTNRNFVADLVKFYSGEALAAYRPQLVIQYYVPVP